MLVLKEGHLVFKGSNTGHCGPLYVFWQVSFGCWITWCISSWQKSLYECLLTQAEWWVAGFFFCLSTAEAWTFCKMNALNPLRFNPHHKNWEKCLLFNLANFWMIELTKISSLTRDLRETIESSPLCITDLFQNKYVAYL